jgi:dTDP-L-rhamnose 4-epimerase
MTRRVLITGGAGFIGSHIATRLLDSGAEVRVFDALHPQVHAERKRPSYLHPDAELIIGDLRDPAAVRRALDGIDSVIHLAARVGVAQSMYELSEYASTNALGTAVLLEALTQHRVERLVVASSMSIYGEGLYVDDSGRPCENASRTREQLEAGRWQPVGEHGQPLEPVATPESKQPSACSSYALEKYYQERLCLIFGATYEVPTTALRLFNVYGPHQALSNPYTGVLAIFASRLLNGRPPLIFEDGEQRRDFVSVKDVASAFALALVSPDVDGMAINIGSGQSVTINEIATRFARVLGREDVGRAINGKYRAGDIRHCFADISRADRVLRYRPEVSMDDGMREFAAWLEGQVAVDRVDQMAAELSARSLMLGGGPRIQ